MRITKLELQNIGVFEHLDIVFPEKVQQDKAEIHIFTGENGTGKSTLLYALACQAHYQTYPYLQNRFRYTNDKSKIVTSYYDSGHVPITQTSFGGTGHIEHTHPSYYEPVSAYMHKLTSAITTYSFAYFSYSGYRKTEQVKIGAIQELTDNPLQNANDFNTSANVYQLVQWIANTKTKEALELIKNGSGRPERYRKAIARIEQAVSEIIDKSVEFVMETDPLGVSIKLNNQIISLDLLPDGLKSIISWIADLLMRMDRIKWATNEEVFDRNFILFLDEIEVHLHPAWQRKILPVVQKLFTNAQIFISTHSPFVVGSVDDAWVYKLENVNGNAHLANGFPVLSSSGKSYQLVLDEIFGIESEFSENLEKELQEFYTIREELLHKDFHQEAAFIEKARQLAEKSPEVRDIVGREIRQLNRLLQKEYAL
jgi:predicted ATP-binding protein involved in virulence